MYEALCYWCMWPYDTSVCGLKPVHLHSGTLDTYVRMILHMCLHTTIYVSQYLRICTLTLSIYAYKLATLAIYRHRILLYISVLMSANYYCMRP